MGITCCCINIFTSISTSDWISLLGVVVNAGLAYWIVKTIQNRLTNKRVLKDHIINEVKDIRLEYKVYFNDLYSGKVNPQHIIPWFKLMNIKINDLMSIINDKYSIDINKLKPYQIEFQELITNNEDFINHFKGKKVVFSQNSKAQLIKFQQSHSSLFNKLIISVNDAH